MKNAFVVNSLTKQAVTDTEDKKLISFFTHRVPYVCVGMNLHRRPELIEYLFDEGVDLSGEDSLASILTGKGDLDILELILHRYPELAGSAIHGAIADENIEVLEHLLTLEGADLKQVVTDIMDNDRGLESREMLEYLLPLVPGVELSPWGCEL